MESDNNPADPPKALLTAVRAILRPLVRLLIDRGITLPVLTALTKEAYIDIAVANFPVNGKKQTDSRVSLLTGVHRKDVKRLRDKTREDLIVPSSIGLGAQVVARWISSPETTDDDGRPLPLPRQAKIADEPSFDGLVEGISTDVRPRAVLDEWLRLGVAHIGKNGEVVLNRQAFIPEKGFDEKAFYFGRNIHDHLAATVNNLIGENNPQLERSVHYGKLSDESVQELAKISEQVGMEALLTVNRLALEFAKQDKSKPDANNRVNFGLYFFDSPINLSREPSGNEDK